MSGYSDIYSDIYVADSYPDLKVECAFGVPWDQVPADADWVDITADLEHCTIEDGKQSELDRFTTGTLTARLKNKNRQYEPGYADSPHYPNIGPDQWVRVRAGSRYLFTGFTDDESFKPNFNLPPVAVLSAEDTTSALATKTLEHPFVFEALKHSPRAYWRLNESSNGQAVIDYSGNKFDGVYVGGPTPGQSDPITDGTDGSVLFDPAANPQYVDCGIGPSFSGNQLTVIIFAKFFPGGQGYFIAQAPNVAGDANNHFALSVDNTNVIWRILSTFIGATKPSADDWHMYAGVLNGTAMRLLIDGVLATTGTATAAPTGGVGVWLGQSPAFTGTGFHGYLDEPMIIPAALTDAQILEIYNARTAWANDLSGARVNRVLDQVGWPASMRVIDPGNTQLQSEPALAGQNALDHLRLVEQTEGGGLYADGRGRIRFRERHAIYKSPLMDSQLTLGRGPGQLPYAAIEPETPPIYNEVRIQRRDGHAQIATDTSSPYKPRGYDRTGQLYRSDAEARDAARYFLERHKTLETAFKAVSVNPYVDTGLWAHVLGRGLEDLITVERRTLDGALVNRKGHIIGRRHQIDPARKWLTTWKLSRADIKQYWLVGVAGRSEVGVTTVVGY